MDTCFLFVDTIDEHGCLSLTLNDSGAVVDAPEKRSFEDIKRLQAEKKTWVIDSTLHATLLNLELPWLPERKARMAIPYALEDRLAESVETLHFCFDKSHYQNQHYLIVAISKARMDFITGQLKQHGVDWEQMTLDWFALRSGESIVLPSYCLISNNEYKGALALNLAKTMLPQNPEHPPLSFSDSPAKIFKHSTRVDQQSPIYIAQQLQKTSPMNLAQGSYQQKAKGDLVKKGYILCGILAGVWLVALLLSNAVSLYMLNQKNSVMDEHIATLYRHFFPEAKQVISPRFRIEQLLGGASQDSGSLWNMLYILSQQTKPDVHHIEKLQYQNRVLTVRLHCSDFATLEAFEKALQKQNIKVKQMQAATQDQRVIASLELS